MVKIAETPTVQTEAPPAAIKGSLLTIDTTPVWRERVALPRQLRIEDPGAIDPVMNRGDRREPIYQEEADRTRFLPTLGEACRKTDGPIHASCLRGNHFHVVVATPGGHLVAGMRWFLSPYPARFHRRHQLFGHLFRGRDKALLVDGSGHGSWRAVCD